MNKTPSQINVGDTVVINTFRHKVVNVADCHDGYFVLFFETGTSIAMKSDECIEVSQFFDISNSAPVTRKKPTTYRGISID